MPDTKLYYFEANSFYIIVDNKGIFVSAIDNNSSPEDIQLLVEYFGATLNLIELKIAQNISSLIPEEVVDVLSNEIVAAIKQ